MGRNSDTYPVIALVCSAGGLEALQTVLMSLPANLPAAVLVLQHSSPEHPSLLAAILDRDSALPVVVAGDGDELTASRVLVAPSGYHTLISAQRTIALIPSGDRPPYRPSADLLLTTLAVAVQNHAIAVVLSGQGNDGATGATAVHRFGGTVIVSSPETSTRTPMPNATMNRDGITDHILPLRDVAALLIAIATTPLIQPI